MLTVRGAVRRLSKISNCAFECDYYDDDNDDDDDDDDDHYNYYNLNIRTPLPTLPCAWCLRVSVRTGWLGVTIL